MRAIEQIIKEGKECQGAQAVRDEQRELAERFGTAWRTVMRDANASLDALTDEQIEKALAPRA